MGRRCKSVTAEPQLRVCSCDCSICDTATSQFIFPSKWISFNIMTHFCAEEASPWGLMFFLIVADRVFCVSLRAIPLCAECLVNVVDIHAGRLLMCHAPRQNC